MYLVKKRDVSLIKSIHFGVSRGSHSRRKMLKNCVGKFRSCKVHFYPSNNQFKKLLSAKQTNRAWLNKHVSKSRLFGQNLIYAEEVSKPGHGMDWNGRRFFLIPYWQFSSIPFPFHTKNLPFNIPFHTKIFFHIPFHTKIFFHIPFHTSIPKNF